MVKKLIKKHTIGRTKTVWKALKAESYYRNKNDILIYDRKKNDDSDNPLRNADNRISSNFHGLLVNQKASYMFTAPPLFDVGNKEVLSDSALFSTSTDIYDPNDDLRVIILKSKSGAVLGKYDETEEKEVTFSKNTVFKVVKCYTERRENDKLVLIIEVTEVE